MMWQASPGFLLLLSWGAWVLLEKEVQLALAKSEWQNHLIVNRL